MFGFLNKLIEKLTGPPQFGARSPNWAKVRDKFIDSHPFCECCGGYEDLEVHHIIPFHIDRSLELEESNLITLCRPHHLLLGHLMSWKSFNRAVRQDADTWRNKIRVRP